MQSPEWFANQEMSRSKNHDTICGIGIHEFQRPTVESCFYIDNNGGELRHSQDISLNVLFK